MKASEIVAKLERQFERGLITAPEYASELLAVACGEGEAAVHRYEQMCAYVLTTITGEETSVRYFRTECERDFAYDAWNSSMADVYDVILPSGDWMCTGTNYVKEVPSSALSQVRCVRPYDVDCPCGECL